MKVSIGADHGGFELKGALVKALSGAHEMTDRGPADAASCDYPDYAKKVCDAVNAKDADFGILCCGTGAGMCIAANKIKGIRAMLCDNTTTAHLVKEHNNCNVITLGARVAEPGEFTKRAFLAGRIDLSQAEAVIDLIKAKSGRSFDSAVSQLSGSVSKKVKEIRNDILDILVSLTVNMDYPDEDIEHRKISNRSNSLDVRHIDSTV